jgi:hypothetical protein
VAMGGSGAPRFWRDGQVAVDDRDSAERAGSGVVAFGRERRTEWRNLAVGAVRASFCSVGARRQSPLGTCGCFWLCVLGGSSDLGAPCRAGIVVELPASRD